MAAKLSRKFYEKLGDDIATELVEWFNQVDASYRSDLRDFNDANFARFDAKLEQRLAETGAEMTAGFARADARLEQGLGAVRAEMTAGFAGADAKLEQRLAKMRAETRTGLAEARADLRQEIAGVRADLHKWMFRYWLGSVAANVALIVAVMALLKR